MENLKEFPEDMSPEEKQYLEKFIVNGCPGVVQTTEGNILQWFRLYMSGKTYFEISKITNKKIDLILYVSHKSKWNEKKMEHYQILLTNITNKAAQVKLDSANTVAGMIASLNKYYSDKFNKYLLNNDDSIIEDIDTKLLSQYYKSMESLDKMLTPQDKNPLGDSSNTIDAESIKVTTPEEVGKALTLLAKIKRDNEKEDSN